MITWAWDSESYYASGFDLKSLGSWQYIFHPDADHYLVSVAASDGTKFVGKPEDAPWDRMAGGIWVCHNTSHDGLVFQRLVRDSRIPNVQPSEWVDTADLAAFCGYPRSLKLAVQTMLGVAISKDTRDSMKNKRWHEMTPEFKAEVEQYALGDSEWCLKLWQEYGDRWPARERRLSQITREMGWRGIFVDVDRVDRGIKHLQLLCWAAESKIPWSGDAPALSYPQLVKACLAAGIDAPSSLAMGDEGCDYWLDRHPDVPWISAMRIKRRCNALLRKLQTVRERVRPEDSRMPYSLKYCGAGVTQRWSGDAGVNLQNLNSVEMWGKEWWEAQGRSLLGDLLPDVIEGVDLRRCFVAAPGMKLAICDEEQIEPRCAAYLVGDRVSLALMAEGQSPYEAHARTTMGYTGVEPLKKSDPAKYKLSKIRTLLLGYGGGHAKLLQTTEDQSIFGGLVTDGEIKAYESYLLRVKMPMWTAAWRKADDDEKRRLVNSWKIVQDYRQSSPRIVGAWRRFQNALKEAVGEDLEIELPGGFVLRYRQVALTEDGITNIIPKFGKLMRVHNRGSQIFENAVQFMARQVFADAMLRVADAGYDIVLQVHDELCCEIPEHESAQKIADLMSIPPAFLPGLPVAASVTESAFYLK